MLDSVPLRPAVKRDDFVSITLDAFSAIQFKQLLLMLVSFIVVSSNMFIDGPLSRFDGAVSAGQPTSYGVIIQGVALCIVMVIGGLLVSQGIM